MVAHDPRPVPLQRLAALATVALLAPATLAGQDPEPLPEPPTPEQEEVGRELAAKAEREILDNDLFAADRFLGHCIELSDLPACHRRLASILFLVRDGSAPAHNDAAKGIKQKTPRP